MRDIRTIKINMKELKEFLEGMFWFIVTFLFLGVVGIALKFVWVFLPAFILLFMYLDKTKKI